MNTATRFEESVALSGTHLTTPADPGKPLQPPTTAKGKPTKPNKPYPEFPLTAHPAGYWCKKIRGKLHYFGPWSDLDGALAKYLEQKDALHAGKTPRPEPGALTVRDLASTFLNHSAAEPP